MEPSTLPQRLVPVAGCVLRGAAPPHACESAATTATAAATTAGVCKLRRFWERGARHDGGLPRVPEFPFTTDGSCDGGEPHRGAAAQTHAQPFLHYTKAEESRLGVAAELGCHYQARERRRGRWWCGRAAISSEIGDADGDFHGEVGTRGTCNLGGDPHSGLAASTAHASPRTPPRRETSSQDEGRGQGQEQGQGLGAPVPAPWRHSEVEEATTVDERERQGPEQAPPPCALADATVDADAVDGACAHDTIDATTAVVEVDATEIPFSACMSSRGDRFAHAVRAVVLLCRCRTALLTCSCRGWLVWATAAALFRHRMITTRRSSFVARLASAQYLAEATIEELNADLHLVVDLGGCIENELERRRQDGTESINDSGSTREGRERAGLRHQMPRAAVLGDDGGAALGTLMLEERSTTVVRAESPFGFGAGGDVQRFHVEAFMAPFGFPRDRWADGLDDEAALAFEDPDIEGPEKHFFRDRAAIMSGDGGDLVDDPDLDREIEALATAQILAHAAAHPKVAEETQGDDNDGGITAPSARQRRGGRRQRRQPI